MTILGRGDLSPRRKYGYGRRRRWPRVVLTLIVVAALGVGGYYGWRELRGNDTATVAAGASCRTRTAVPVASPPPRVTAKVLNGSLKTGLAKSVARTLHRRFGVVVAKVGNAPRFTRGDSVVRYPRRLTTPARALAAYVVPPPRLVASARLATVELDIGTRFRSVAPRPRTPAAVPSPSATSCRHS